VRDCNCNVDVTSGETCCLEGRRRQGGVGEDGAAADRRFGENAIFFENTIARS
jgi:hypothetical protein